MSQIVLYPCICTYMAETPNDANYGIINRMRVGASDKGGYAYRALIRIDLSLIGAATIANTSKLELYDVIGGDGSTSYYAYLVLQTGWTEEGCTWEKYDGVKTWDSGGCGTDDVDHDETFQTESLSLAAPGWQTWVGGDPNYFSTILQEAIDSHGGMLDILIMSGNELQDMYSSFYSEDTVPLGSTPKLTIDYTGGNVPNIASIGVKHLVSSPVYWTCIKTIAGEPIAHVKTLAGVSEH